MSEEWDWTLVWLEAGNWSQTHSQQPDCSWNMQQYSTLNRLGCDWLPGVDIVWHGLKKLNIWQLGLVNQISVELFVCLFGIVDMSREPELEKMSGHHQSITTIVTCHQSLTNQLYNQSTNHYLVQLLSTLAPWSQDTPWQQQEHKQDLWLVNNIKYLTLIGQF